MDIFTLSDCIHGAMLKTPIEAPILPIMNQAELEVENEDKLGFTILQCKECRSIIGDTSSVLNFNRETSLITLHSNLNYGRVTSVLISN